METIDRKLERKTKQNRIIQENEYNLWDQNLNNSQHYLGKNFRSEIQLCYFNKLFSISRTHSYHKCMGNNTDLKKVF